MKQGGRKAEREADGRKAKKGGREGVQQGGRKVEREAGREEGRKGSREGVKVIRNERQAGERGREKEHEGFGG